jgi:hypothetical protein
MKLDRAAVMRRAHRDFRYWKRVGDPKPFGDCLRNAWAVARLARDSGSAKFMKRAA